MENRQRHTSHLRLATVKQVANNPAYGSVFSESAMRHLIFNSKARFNSRGEKIPGNGLCEAGAILRVGRKVLVDLDAFDQWIEEQRVANFNSSHK